MWSLRRPQDAELAAILARVAGLSLTYPEVGMSRTGGAPAYHREDHRSALAIDFATAAERLASFATHELPYMFVYPRDARVVLRRDVVVCAKVGPLWSINPCRIVHVEATPDRFEYAYGTLPGHAEAGEEYFAVSRTTDGRVIGETTAYARMADWIAKLAAPIARRVQRRVKIDYLRALGR